MKMKRKLGVLIAAAMSLSVLAGCGEDFDIPFETDDFESLELFDETFGEDFESWMESDFFEDSFEAPVEDTVAADNTGESSPAGKWYTEDYDEEANWAMSYVIELKEDGTATCEGWRNKDSGTWTETGDKKVLITFDECQTDEAGGGFTMVEGFKYTVEMTINGDDAQIKIDAPDVISNLEDGTVHRKDGGQTASASFGDGDVEIADGEYLTDEQYSGDLSGDAKTLTITTALSHYDDQWNLVPDYPKSTYEFSVAKSCKCVVAAETREEDPISDRIDFVNEFLHGNSGLPITVKVKGGEVVELMFSS